MIAKAARNTMGKAKVKSFFLRFGLTNSGARLGARDFRFFRDMVCSHITVQAIGTCDLAAN